MAETTIHADFERLRRSMDAMSKIHEATLKSMLDGIRESRDEFRQAYHEFKEGLRQDFREFRAGIKQKSEIESNSQRSSSPLIPCPQLQIDRDLRREIPATGSTIPVVTGTTPDPIRFEKPVVDSKIEASQGMQFNFSGVTRVAKHDFPRMVDDIVELAFDGCIGNTQIFDPGGIDGVNDCGECLQSAFDFSIHTQGYDSHYQGVYPVKCKQDRFIVEDIVEFGSNFRFGLEAGSKPEILLAMSCLCKGNPEALLVCNGLKDAEYISLALLGRKLALNTMIVFEQEEELDLVISEVYELVNMLLSQDVCSKKEKSALKEAKSLVNAMLGYMSVCSSNSLNEESTEEVGFSVSIGDLARVWTGSNSELGSFFPLVSDDICKKMNEEDFSVNYLAGVVLVEATLSRTVPIINGDIRSHERVSLSFSDFIRFCKQHMRSKGNGSLVEAKSSCLTPMPDFPIPADHEPGQIARKLCLIFNGWFHLVDSDDLTIAVNFWWESNIMSNMAEHMDSYYLRRITRSLIDREMSLLVSKTSSTDLKQLSANIDQSNTGQAEGVNDISSNERERHRHIARKNAATSFGSG